VTHANNQPRPAEYPAEHWHGQAGREEFFDLAPHDQTAIARQYSKDETLQRLLEDARERDGVTNGPPLPPGPVPLQVRTAKELGEMNLKPPEFVIDGLLPCGVAILAAPSKIGKSWLALDMALSVVRGDPFMGYRTNRSEVLYLALEDSLYRLNERIGKLLAGEPRPDGLCVCVESQTMSGGFVGQLDVFLSEHPNAKLAIVDTFQKFRPQAGKTQTAYEADYQTLGEFKTLSAKHNVCVLLVHHTRKSNGLDVDPFENILGSTALQGATDTMLVIKKKKRTDETTVFAFTGRDVFQRELYICFDKEECRWKNQGYIEEIDEKRAMNVYTSDPLVRTIVDMLKESGMWEGTLLELQDEVVKHTGTVMAEQGNALANKLKRLAPMLQFRDSITYRHSKNPVRHNGKTARLHSFQKTIVDIVDSVTL
jgi:hypothetical protein